jgi:geranylgeranylglycerol-phosphate geranylgeranyltransferase
MVGFAVIVGAMLARSDMVAQQLPNLLFGFSTGFLLSAAAMAINDYYDREIDALNEPNRPIPSGAVQPEEALLVALFLTLFGLMTAFLTAPIPNWRCLALAASSWTIVILYVTKGKGTGLFGNFLVSLCIAVPFIYGSFVLGKSMLPTTSLFISMVFLSNTGREVTKGIVDVQGDKENNIKTIAVLYGARKAAFAAAIFYLSAVALTPLPWLYGIVSFWFIPFVILTDLGLILASLLLVLNPSRENARRIKSRNLFWFLSGLIAFIAGALG